MIRTIFTFVIALSMSSTSFSKEVVGKDLLKCGTESRFFRINCSIAEQRLAINEVNESDVEFIYEYTSCDEKFGEDFLDIYVSSGASRSERLKYGKSGKFRLTGSNNFRIVNNTTREEFKRHRKGCQLNISIGDVSVSQNTLNLIDELDTTIQETRSQLETKKSRVVNTHSFFVSAAGGENTFYCMINDYDDPLFYDEGLLTDLKNEFKRSYGVAYEDASHKCPSTVTLESVIQACLADSFSSRACVFYDAFVDSKNWFTDRIAELDQKFRALKDESSRLKIEGIRADLNRVLEDSQAGIER